MRMFGNKYKIGGDPKDPPKDPPKGAQSANVTKTMSPLRTTVTRRSNDQMVPDAEEGGLYHVKGGGATITAKLPTEATAKGINQTVKENSAFDAASVRTTKNPFPGQANREIKDENRRNMKNSEGTGSRRFVTWPGGGTITDMDGGGNKFESEDAYRRLYNAKQEARKKQEQADEDAAMEKNRRNMERANRKQPVPGGN